MEGIIQKALSGFYYVDSGEEGIIACRARGKHRHSGLTPLVGDRVTFTPLGEGSGALDQILPRRNQFFRPAVANIDLLVVVASQAVPQTDPFLIDRVVSIAEGKGCGSLICINKWDLEPGEALEDIYRRAGLPTLRLSARTGEGLEALRREISGKVCAFTGNSGVGKSSLLNALEPGMDIATGQVSEKLGRGRHTTRHVELFRLSCGALAADTPGFSSFELEGEEVARKERLPYAFREFAPYLGKCRFPDCAHIKEKGCAVLEAVEAGIIPKSRHRSYVRLYEQAKAIPDWERRQSEHGGP